MKGPKRRCRPKRAVAKCPLVAMEEGRGSAFTITGRGFVGSYTPSIAIRVRYGKVLWDGDRITYSFGFPAVEPTERYREDGYLPIIHATWKDDGVEYSQTALVS